MQLYEKYRPDSFDSLIGQDKVVRTINNLLARPEWDRDAIWLQGPSGTGKTTLAWIIARKVAHDFEITELDGDKCNVEAVRDLERNLQLSAMMGTWKVVIINEAHAISRQAVQAWLTLLERLPKHRLIIFTTTETLKENLFGDFSGPFGSRCKVISFTNQGLAQLFAQRAQEIAQAENLDGQPLPKYIRLVQECKNNMRLVLQQIECGAMLKE